MSATDFKTLLDAAQSMMFPAVANDLAEHLGVSPDSLIRLGVGWLASLPDGMGDGLKHPAWGRFIIPERDNKGNLVGLGTRLPPWRCTGKEDKIKSCIRGSNRGLIYELNTLYAPGRHRSYHRGDWKRCQDNNVRCPICHHAVSDGCSVAPDLVSPEVVDCVRVQSDHPSRLGHYHFLKPVDTNRRPFVFIAGKPVVIVEGMTAAAAALTLGYSAIGRPSARDTTYLADVLAGLSCVAMQDNDQKPDGRWPSHEGVTLTLKVLKDACHDTAWCPIPSSVRAGREYRKDIRDWLKDGESLTTEAFATHLLANTRKTFESAVLADDLPHTLAMAFLENPLCRVDGVYRIRARNDVWYEYAGGRYKELPTSLLKSWAIKWLAQQRVMGGTPKAPTVKTMPTTVGHVNDILLNVGSEIIVATPDAPLWLNLPAPEGWENANNILAFENGLLNVGLYTSDNPDPVRYWRPPSAEFFTLTACPFDFDASARSELWAEFVQSSLGDDEKKIDLLQEFMGYCLVADNRYEKFLYLKGEKRAGKGTVLAVIEAMLPEQVETTSIAELGTTFGSSKTKDRMVLVIPDAEVPRQADVTQCLERLKQITGGDRISYEQKYEYSSSIRPHARVIIASNGFLAIDDHNAAMPSRALMLEFARSFALNVDDRFKRRLPLASNLRGIVPWALEGLRRLRANKAFSLPESHHRLLRGWKDTISPVAKFLHKCCTVSPELFAPEVELWDAFVAFSRHHHYSWRGCSSSDFIGSLHDLAGCDILDDDVTVKGVTLTPEARKRYLGSPT